MTIMRTIITIIMATIIKIIITTIMLFSSFNVQFAHITEFWF